METQIKPNELRLGSIILYDGFPNKVVSIMAPSPRDDRFDGKWAVEINPPDSFWVCLDELEPIPLDETWLRRAGFDNGWILSHNREEFNMFYTGGVYFYSADYLHHNSVAIKYVHQLQNLFFCLSGKELIFQ